MVPRSRAELRFPAGKAGLLAAMVMLASGCNRGILDPVGPVGQAEKTIPVSYTHLTLPTILRV